MYFASDNGSAAHPKVMDALVAANEGYSASYGDDQIMARVREKIRTLFEAPDAAVYLVATGTTANSLSLAVNVKPWQAIYCHDVSHIQTDECNAPEFYTGGAKLTVVGGGNGLISVPELTQAIEKTVHGDVHHTQRGAISITNLSEAGTAYSPEDIGSISGVAQNYGMPLHMDGARFANALVAQGCSAAELTWKSGVDVLSFGGTKNGLLGVEAVVMFDPAQAWEFELRRKRAGHLFSKHRYLSAQMDAYLENNLWRDMARIANESAARLSRGISEITDASLVYPTDGNIVFAKLPRAAHRRAMNGGAIYYFMNAADTTDGPDQDCLGARFVCSWSTTKADVDQFLELARS